MSDKTQDQKNDDPIERLAAAAADRFFRSKGVSEGESMSITKEQFSGVIAGALDINKDAIHVYLKVRSFEHEIDEVAQLIADVVLVKLHPGLALTARDVVLSLAQVKWLVAFSLHGHTSYLLGRDELDAAMSSPPMPGKPNTAPSTVKH